MGRYVPWTYRRPAYMKKVLSRDSEFTGAEKTHTNGDSSLKSGKSGSSLAGIPPALSFNRIIDGGTCPPCTIRDFMNYLIYIERSAENLQFFLWYRDYQKRFLDAKTSDVALAPEWTQAMQEEAMARIVKENIEKLRKGPQGTVGAIFQATDFEKQRGDSSADPFSTPPHTSHDCDQQSDVQSSNAATLRSQASEAFVAAGVKPPFTIQPFRAEMDRVITTYIMDGSPRQLNLSAREQKSVMQSLSYTTHPSAFVAVVKSVEASLRRQAHPNFIRWSICNGNPARVTFARGLGASLIFAGVVVALLLTLSDAGRGWRVFAAFAWVLGIATLIAAYKGMCVVLHGLHHHHVRPWELFVSGDELDVHDRKRTSFESFGSSNSYEDEPWVVRYKKRNLVRRIFDREVWIQEPALRQIQDVIFVQSVFAAVLFGAVLTALFVAVPGGHFFR